ncbi:hypothetical protein B7463_g8788, partial [Scytalidium lignicola]
MARNEFEQQSQLLKGLDSQDSDEELNDYMDESDWDCDDTEKSNDSGSMFLEDSSESKQQDPTDMEIQLWRVDDVYDIESDARMIYPYDPNRYIRNDKGEATLSPEKCEGSVLNILEDEAANLESDSPLLEWPHHGMFRHKDKLTESHVNVLLDLINTEFAAQLQNINAMFPKGISNFDILQDAFQPGDIIVDNNSDDVRAYLVKDTLYRDENYGGKRRDIRFYINVKYIDSDGNKFGTCDATFTIKKFKGVKFLNKLPVFPLKYHSNSKRVFEVLVNRGRKFVSLNGQHFKFLKGIVSSIEGSRMDVNSRVVVDTATYQRLNSRYGGIVNEIRRQLTEEELAACIDTIPAFSLCDKQWCIVNIELIEDITFNKDVFDQLVLDDENKGLARVMVEQHIRGTNFDDFIEGKGKAIVMLLHGPPGVAVAEYTQRPLYTVTSGELGIHSEVLEKKLKLVLNLANTFGAVLLLDEADVFLERRTSHDLERNALVSIFLRLLEYYQGILILTTNRVGAFDEAFHSRIHIALSYPELSIQARKQIWKNFAGQSVREVTLSEEEYEELARLDLNGRQIKNAFSSSVALAAERQEPISIGHLRIVVNILVNSAMLGLTSKSS